ncbi:hypothetical protein BBJ28_00026149, partial [Nothophytophthora sp. Chile5]
MGKNTTETGDGIYTPQEGGAYAPPTPSSSNGSSKRLTFIGAIVAIFLLLNVIALYILHFVDRGNSGDSVTSSF